MRKDRSAFAVLLGLLLLGPAACRHATSPDGLGADGMTGLWLLPFGGGTVASLTQSGGKITGFAHVMDSPTTCWDNSQRLPVNGSVGSGDAVTLVIGGAYPIHVTGVLSADGTVLNNVHSISNACAPGGYPWEETAVAPGVRLESLSGSYDVRFEVDGVVRSFTATLSHTRMIGPNGEMPVTITGSLGTGWPCAPRAVSSKDFYLMGYWLRGTLSVETVPDFMFVEVSPVSFEWKEFQGSFSGSWDPRSLECIEGFTYGSVTFTKR